jgi:hypothetical protein
LAILGLLALQFALVSAANGLVYLPGKSGGLLLSGHSAALVVLSCLALSTALMLRIIGHRQQVWLAIHHHRILSGLGWGSAALFLIALLTAILGNEPSRPPSWRLDWFDLNPQTVSGWVARTPLKEGPSTQSFLVGFGLLLPAGLWVWIHPAPHTSRVTGLLCGLSLATLGGLWLVHLLFEIGSGQFHHLPDNLPVTWSEAAPAGFQAVATTSLTLALLTLLMGLLMVILAFMPRRDHRSAWPSTRHAANRKTRRKRHRGARP